MKSHLFYRPMTPEKHDILFAGSVEVGSSAGTPDIELNPEVQHLTCFVGGMVALAAKAFNKPHDLQLARKLVDGCTWGYDVTPMGILPEIMHTVPCDNAKDCEWDEDTWLQEIRARGSKVKLAEEIIRDEHLPKGISRFDDTRYGLRYVLRAICLVIANLSLALRRLNPSSYSIELQETPNYKIPHGGCLNRL